MSVLVSVALVTRDGIATLPAVLDAIRSQETAAEVEVVAVDSGSRDGTRELLATRVDRLLEIAPEDFNHGATRNLALEHCRGELVVLLVQDAEPATTEWLKRLIAPLLEDATVAGSFARQRPRPEAGRLERWNLERWVAASPESRVIRLASREEWEAMTPLQRHDAAAFDNVCSCLRRSVWARQPFPTADFAEDLEWGRDALLSGHGLAFAADAVVRHSHRRSLRYEVERTSLAHRRLHELFGVRTIPSLGHLVRSMALTAGEHLRVVRAGDPPPTPAELARALGLAVVWPLGQYLGGRAAVSGRAMRRRGRV